jgi:hypothetical protein
MRQLRAVAHPLDFNFKFHFILYNYLNQFALNNRKAVIHLQSEKTQIMTLLSGGGRLRRRRLQTFE